MPDIEKIIKGVHDTRRYLEDREWVDKSVGVHIDALNDALALLKKQEPMEPITDKLRNYICPVCGNRLRGGEFCMNCGQAVKRSEID